MTEEPVAAFFAFAFCETGLSNYPRVGKRKNPFGMEVFIGGKVAEANGSRTHRRRLATTTTGFEDRESHRTLCASVGRKNTSVWGTRTYPSFNPILSEVQQRMEQ